MQITRMHEHSYTQPTDSTTIFNFSVSLSISVVCFFFLSFSLIRIHASTPTHSSSTYYVEKHSSVRLLSPMRAFRSLLEHRTIPVEWLLHLSPQFVDIWYSHASPQPFGALWCQKFYLFVSILVWVRLASGFCSFRFSLQCCQKNISMNKEQVEDLVLVHITFVLLFYFGDAMFQMLTIIIAVAVVDCVDDDHWSYWR